jgi:hypothetical protein
MDLQVCTEMMQGRDRPDESSTWRVWAQIAHKVIHRTGGHLEKAFPIMDLLALFEMEPPIRAQLHTGLV